MANPGSYATARKLLRQDFVKCLFANISFLKRSRNWSESAQGKRVEWTGEGAKPGLKKNRVSGYTATERTDILMGYDLNEYSTDPTALSWTEEQIVLPGKRASILEQHLKTQDEGVAKDMLYYWGKDAKQIRTSGSSKAAKLTGMTGTRKKIVFANLLEAFEVLNGDEVELEGRLMTISPFMYSDLFDMQEFTSLINIGRNLLNAMIAGQAPLPSGVIGQVLGMDVYMTSAALLFDNSAKPVAKEPVPPDPAVFAIAGSDNIGCTIYNENYVTRAVSPATKVSIKYEHGGDEFSTQLIAGGAPFRNDKKGVVNIIQSAA